MGTLQCFPRVDNSLSMLTNQSNLWTAERDQLRPLVVAESGTGVTECYNVAVIRMTTPRSHGRSVTAACRPTTGRPVGPSACSLQRRQRQSCRGQLRGTTNELITQRVNIIGRVVTKTERVCAPPEYIPEMFDYTRP